MDPRTGELWTEEQIQELASASAASAAELRERLVTVEGTEAAISELQTRVRQGAIAERAAGDILAARPKMAIPQTRKPRH